MDTPKGFSRLLRYKEMSIKREKEKKEAKANPEVTREIQQSEHVITIFF